LSKTEEIREVFEQDIREKTKIVYNKHGIQAFLDKEGMQIKDLFDGLVTSEDRELLQRILDGEEDVG
jgi:exonuclease I